MNQDREYAELKRLVEFLPDLEKRHHNAYHALLVERDSQWGKDENGFIYHVRPSVQNNYEFTLNEYSECQERVFELCKKFNLSVNTKGIPDLNESKIKPYGLTEDEKYKMESHFNFNSPIGLP